MLTLGWQSASSDADGNVVAAASPSPSPSKHDPAGSAHVDGVQRRHKPGPELSRVVVPKRTAVQGSECEECSCEADLARLEDALQEEKYGINQEWPEPTTDDQIFHPEEFRSNFNKVMEECGFEAESLKIDCDEPPCIASVRGPKNFSDWREILKCPAWTDLGYPLSAMVQESRTNCGGGMVPFYMISPHWKSYFEDESGVTSPEKMKRLEGRQRQLAETACDSATGDFG